MAADLHLVGLWRAILRWPAFHHVADIHVFAQDRNAFTLGRAFDHLREQLSRAAHERKTLGVFIRARTFTHENQLSLRISRAKHDAVTRFMQAAAFTVADILADLFECVTLGRQAG